MILDAATRWDKEGSDCAPVASPAESAVLSDEVNGNDRKHFFFAEVTIKKIKGQQSHVEYLRKKID